MRVADGEGWGEDCTGAAQLIIHEGAIYLVESQWIREAKRNETFFKKLPMRPATKEVLETRFKELIDIENKYQILMREKKNEIL